MRLAQMFWDDEIQALADSLGRGMTEYRFRTRIPYADDALRVRKDKRFGHAFKNVAIYRFRVAIQHMPLPFQSTEPKNPRYSSERISCVTLSTMTGLSKYVTE